MIATQTALKLADYVVTEAGFGADLGAEKFIDIKCRKTGLRARGRGASWPRSARSSTTAASTWRIWASENLEALEKGIANIERHVDNIRNNYGLPCVVAINHRTEDTDAEVKMLHGQDGRTTAPR